MAKSLHGVYQVFVVGDNFEFTPASTDVSMFNEPAQAEVVEPALSETTPVCLEVPEKPVSTETTVDATESMVMPEEKKATAPTVQLSQYQKVAEKLKEWGASLGVAADCVFGTGASRQDAFNALEFIKKAAKVRFESWDLAIIEEMIREDGLPSEMFTYLFDGHSQIKAVLEDAYDAKAKTKALTLINGLVTEIKKAKDCLFDRTDPARRALAQKHKHLPPKDTREFNVLRFGVESRFKENLKLGNIGAAKSALKEIEEVLGTSRPDLWQDVAIAERVKKAQKNNKQKKRA